MMGGMPAKRKTVSKKNSPSAAKPKPKPPAKRSTHARLKQVRAEMDSYAGATHNIQWIDHLCYKVCGKIFAILGRDETGATAMSIKCSPKDFAAMTKNKGVTQAPYLAKKMWIRVADIDAIGWKNLRGWIRRSYELVVEGLPARERSSLLDYAA